MTTPTLIGIAGFARAGKDTIGAHLVAQYGYQRRAFADKLRELALAADPILTEDDHGHRYHYAEALDHYGYEQAKDHFSEVRAFLVRLGAGARQVLGPDVWLDALLPLPGPHAWKFAEPGTPTVVTDVRYVNEAKRIQALGGQIWYVSRSEAAAANTEEAHSLSRVLAECAPIGHFYNNGSIDDLLRQVDARLA